MTFSFSIPGETLAFLLVWFLLVPPSAALISDDIVNERLGSALTSWIDRKFRGSLAAYFVRCPHCLSHWAVFVFAALLHRQWLSLPIEDRVFHGAAVVLSILSTIRITRRFLS